jgi:hypothetical protein
MAGETRVILAAVLAAAVLAGCRVADGDAPAAPEDGSVLTGPPTGGAEPGVPGIEIVPRPEQTIAAGRLSPVNNSGVTGSVNVRGIGDRTEIAMNVTGLPAGTESVNAAVAAGPCSGAGADIAPIGPLTVGPGGIAAVTDTLALAPGTVLDGTHAVVVRAIEAGPAVPPLACAELPAWERLPPPG